MNVLSIFRSYIAIKFVQISQADIKSTDRNEEA